MKRVLMILFCVCVLSVPAFAVELSDFEYLTVDGTYEINYDSYYYSLAQEKIAVSGVALDANDYWVDNGLVSPGEPLRYFDNAAFEADYAAALAALEESEQSDGTDNAISDTSISNEPSSDVSSGNKYPLGSFIDEEGNVYSPEGELLSTGTETISYLDAIAPVLDEVETTSDETLVGDEVSESHVYNVVDLRSGVTSDSDVSFLAEGPVVPVTCPSCGYSGALEGSCDSFYCNNINTCSYISCPSCGVVTYSVHCTVSDGCTSYICAGHQSDYVEETPDTGDDSDTQLPTVIGGMKALIVSIFGEYEPIMTTGTVTETVGDTTTTTLYDTVAAGAAGIDFTWLAGVLLFGILLFCLMKLLGGILK